MNDCWAIHIDIEGFSVLYPKGDDAIWGLNELMLGIHRLGKNVFPEPPDKLFAYQLGDGFLIVSDFHEENLDRAASITIFLMKYITSFNIFCRATIAEGGMSDITGCYPEEVMNKCDKNDQGKSSMGAGLMTIFPVMGTALINAVRIDKESPKGPLITFPIEYRKRLSDVFIINDIPDTQLASIDWVHTETGNFLEIGKKALLKYLCPEDLEKRIVNYIAENSLSLEWKKSCASYLGVSYN